jgi:hypothetical protein
MTEHTSPLEWGPISLVRRNHGLEHATINLLSKRHPERAFAGHSDARGVWIMGEVSTDELVTTIKTALSRMNSGERGLAIHDHCGTNAVTTGLLAGTAAWLATLKTENNWKKKLDRWPLVILLVTGAIILAQPLGPIVQAKVTTSGAPGGLHITKVTRYERSQFRPSAVHRVETADGEVEETNELIEA